MTRIPPQPPAICRVCNEVEVPDTDHGQFDEDGAMCDRCIADADPEFETCATATASVRSMPCSACPYRLDAPSGAWAAQEYEKLRDYDNPTAEQPFGTFGCHATPDHLCHGWAVVHTNRGHEFDLIALRLAGYPEIPEAGVPLFASGNEAADHGQRDIEDPSDAARQAARRLMAKHGRLETA